MAPNVFVSSKTSSVKTTWPIVFSFCWLNLPDFCSSQVKIALLGPIKNCFNYSFISFSYNFQHDLMDFKTGAK